MTATRIGLSQRVDSIEGRERRDALDQRWGALLDEAGYVPVPIPNRLSHPAKFLESLGIDMLILTGGNDIDGLDGAVGTAPERDATEGQLLAAAAEHGLPVLGVCRGLQAMLHLDGAVLERVHGHVGQAHPITVVTPSEWPVRDARVVNSFHDWAVRPEDLGPSFVPLALASDGTVEAACHRSLPRVCVMWHPERAPEDPDDLALVRALIGAR
jgi:putative glutamine amidotransferase